MFCIFLLNFLIVIVILAQKVNKIVFVKQIDKPSAQASGTHPSQGNLGKGTIKNPSSFVY